MKTKLVLLLVAILPLAARAADDLSTALQKGLFEEEANQNLPAAIKAYESLLAASDEQRKLAATALFRLGECYRKLGRTNDAVAQYQRLLRDYMDQETLVTLSRQNLRGLGVSPVLVTPESQNVSGDMAAMSSEAKLRLKGLLQNEISIAERFAREQRKRIEAGTLPVGDAIRFERDVLGLKRQLVAVDGISSSADRSDWQRLVQEEIKLAEDAVEFEKKKLESGRSTAGEVARLQRDVLTLKRELVMFENTAVRVSPVVRQESVPVSAEAEELARMERILVQLEGRDLSQIRRLLPTLVPDVDFERYDRMLAEAQEKIEDCRAGKLNCTEEEERKLAQTADQSKSRLLQRIDEVKHMLQDRIANLRALVEKQTAEAARPVSDVVSDPSAAAARMAEAAQAAGLLKQLESLTRPELIHVLPTVAPDVLLNSFLEQLAQAERKRAELKPKFADGHPEMKAVESNLKQLDQQIAERIDGIIKGLEIRAAALKQQAVTTAGLVGDNRPVTAAPLSEEEQEIRRIQALIKNSPDLINAVNLEIEKVRSGELMVPKNGTLLHKAANLGQLTVAKFLIEHGADVSARDEMGRTPLHRAAGNGHKAMVELLLANKADANATVSTYTEIGSTSLNLAVKKGYRSVCVALLEHGADPNLGGGSLPIYSAVFARDEASLRLLIAKGAKVDPYSEMKSDTPLHHATTAAIATMLIEAGAPVDALNAANQSPLHTKAREGNIAVLEILLAAGANPSFKDKDGKTPLHLAAIGWHADVVTALIAKGANPNERDSGGGTPLDALIRSGDGDQRNRSFAPQIETLRAILGGGADPNLIQRGGSPHLYRAVAEGLEEQAEILLKAGADPNTKYVYSTGWETPLIAALRGTRRTERSNVKTRSLSLVNLLLRYKADPNLADGAGTSPLWYAIVHGSNDFTEKVPFVEALLQGGAHIEGRDSDGKTPLTVAMERGMKEMTELLLNNKANPNVKAANGMSPLHFAAWNRNMELLEMLLAAGADSNALDGEGRSALDYVKQSGIQPTGIRNIRTGIVSGLPGQQSSQAKATTPSELADRLRKAGARDWAPRPGLITVTRRSSGKSQVIFTKGTNDWNRHSLIEVLAFTYFGSETSFPFPDFSQLLVTRLDRATGKVQEFTVDLAAALAKDGCKADQWLEWGDLVDIPEGVHKLDERWDKLDGLISAQLAKCVARGVTLKINGVSKELVLDKGSWINSQPQPGVPIKYLPEKTFRLDESVRRSGLLLSSSDLSKVKVTRSDETNGHREWMFDLSKPILDAENLWLRDGDLIEVPEKQ